MILFTDLVACRWLTARAPEAPPPADDGITWVKAREVREAPHLDPVVFGPAPHRGT